MVEAAQRDIVANGIRLQVMEQGEGQGLRMKLS